MAAYRQLPSPGTRWIANPFLVVHKSTLMETFGPGVLASPQRMTTNAHHLKPLLTNAAPGRKRDAI